MQRWFIEELAGYQLKAPYQSPSFHHLKQCGPVLVVLGPHIQEDIWSSDVLLKTSTLEILLCYFTNMLLPDRKTQDRRGWKVAMPLPVHVPQRLAWDLLIMISGIQTIQHSSRRNQQSLISTSPHPAHQVRFW